ncbi:MAG: NAD(P)-dependent oxidoreductase [Gammaproteobacteria bacterium]|nr:NAD(P)-dependent oxidoreductase [Gammaproteobacteria bacterium]MBQ0838649.1 NAD(P)-dependent oxidoreductase [Gammaproteobacteria bacterium]
MKIGFIGLGRMGNPMVVNLLAAGSKMVIHDLVREEASNLELQGAKWVDSVKEVAELCDVVITCLPGQQQVDELVLGANGLFNNLAAGSIYIDMTTTSAAAIRHLGQEAAKRGVRILEAPLEGRIVNAREASLVIHAGGDDELVGEMEATLQPLGEVRNEGALGCGNNSLAAA